MKKLIVRWVNTGWVHHECGNPDGIRKRHRWLIKTIRRGVVMRFCSNCGREDKAMVFTEKPEGSK